MYVYNLTCISLDSLNVPKLGGIAESMKSRCHKIHEALQSCKNEDECTRASVAMTVCTGSIVCPDQTKDFVKASETKGVNPNGPYGSLVACMERFERYVIVCMCI